MTRNPELSVHDELDLNLAMDRLESAMKPVKRVLKRQNGKEGRTEEDALEILTTMEQLLDLIDNFAWPQSAQ